MKKIALLITVMLLSMVASAQTASDVQPTSYKPVLSEGKCWTMGYKLAIAPWYGDVYNFKETKLEGDTIIGGIRFMREYIKSWTPRRGEQKPEEWTATNSYLGEDGGKVYLCDGTDESIRPIMDFSLGENEIFPMHGEDGAVVTAVSDTILVNSTDKVPRKCMHLSIVGIEVDVWVEGIGSLNNGLDGLDIGRLGAEPMLEKCVEGDNIIFQLDVFNDQTSTNPGENMAYHPFLKEGKAWNYQEYYHNTWNGEQWTKDVSYVIDGTTEIDGKTYYKMYRVTKEDHEYYCALREEDRKVWQYTSGGDQLIYDFGMSVGDSYMPINEWYNFHLTAINTIQVHNVELKVFNYDVRIGIVDTDLASNLPVVEGVGSVEGWELKRVFLEQPTNGISHGERFLSCYEAGRCIFTADDFNSLNNPNPGENMAYHPFLKEGKAWSYQEYYHNTWNGEQWTKDVSYVIDGTTEIDGKTYYKMYRVTKEDHEYYCALREEDRKVWVYPNYQGDQLLYDPSFECDHLLYDFGMSVGDSYVPPFESRSYQLTSIKPMQFHDDQLLNVFHYEILQKVNSPTPAALVPIVEGVGCKKGWDITRLYAAEPTNGISHGERFLSCYEAGRCIFTADDFNSLNNPNPVEDIAYRPFVEEGKVWKVGTISGNPVQVVDYYYFDGDTIIGGKTCKQMMCQRFVGSDFSDDNWTPTPSLSKVGAWYEEDKKVYFYDESKQSMVLKYDFSLGDNESLQLIDDYPPFTIGPKQTGGIEGFKGVYRDVMIDQNVRSTTWLEGVGGIDGPTRNAYPENADPMPEFLMSCTVGDEVIYLNDEYEDGATPHVLLARKNRFDFTHTIKTRPQLPRNNGSGDAEMSGMDDAEESEELSIYGEYSSLRLDINLDPLADAYQVHITDEAGQVVYEKTINAGSIVALSIDISAYAKGLYTVTVENSYESFTGEFDTQTAGIEAIRNTKEVINTEIYNLHGQRLSSLQKGLNIVNGQKVFKSK